MSPLKIIKRDAETGPVLEVIGDLDFAHAPELRERLSRSSSRRADAWCWTWPAWSSATPAASPR